MTFLLILNLVAQILSYVFIALLILVSYWKITRGTKEEDITILNLFTGTLAAFITSAFLLLMAGWVWDWLGFTSVLLGIGIGIFCALVSHVKRGENNAVLVEGRRFGTILWILSVVIGEFILVWFSQSTALQASFLFGFFMVLSMNMVYAFRYAKVQTTIKHNKNQNLQ